MIWLNNAISDIRQIRVIVHCKQWTFIHPTFLDVLLAPHIKKTTLFFTVENWLRKRCKR